MPISYYFILSILDVEAVSFKSGQRKRNKEKERYVLKEINLGHIWLQKLLFSLIWPLAWI